jgi:hypothetical protein
MIEVIIEEKIQELEQKIEWLQKKRIKLSGTWQGQIISQDIQALKKELAEWKG